MTKALTLAKGHCKFLARTLRAIHAVKGAKCALTLHDDQRLTVVPSAWAELSIRMEIKNAHTRKSTMGQMSDVAQLQGAFANIRAEEAEVHINKASIGIHEGSKKVTIRTQYQYQDPLDASNMSYHVLATVPLEDLASLLFWPTHIGTNDGIMLLTPKLLMSLDSTQRQLMTMIDLSTLKLPSTIDVDGTKIPLQISANTKRLATIVRLLGAAAKTPEVELGVHVLNDSIADLAYTVKDNNRSVTVRQRLLDDNRTAQLMTVYGKAKNLKTTNKITVNTPEFIAALEAASQVTINEDMIGIRGTADKATVETAYSTFAAELPVTSDCIFELHIKTSSLLSIIRSLKSRTDPETINLLVSPDIPAVTLAIGKHNILVACANHPAGGQKYNISEIPQEAEQC